MSTQNQTPSSSFLVSPTADFWLLGGGSLVAWLVLWLGSGHRDFYGVKNHFGELAVTMASLSLFINYPHFLASYRLAYGRGGSFLRRHWFQTILVPCLLVDYLVGAYWLLNQPGGKTNGEWMLGLSLVFMYFTVGWHYTKQAFGCTMVYAAYQRYPLTRRGRELLRWTLLSVWWYSFAFSCLAPEGMFFGLRYRNPRLPYWLIEGSGYLCGSLVLAVLYFVVYRVWKAQGRLPSATLAVPFVAMLAWFAPCFRQTDYFFYLVPFFHSLQYLTFVYRVERVKTASSVRHLTAITAGLILAGWLAFEVIPGNLDISYDNLRMFGMSYFLLAANVFINVHHYFLDNVLWRVRDDEEVRRALFDA